MNKATQILFVCSIVLGLFCVGCEPIPSISDDTDTDTETETGEDTSSDVDSDSDSDSDDDTDFDEIKEQLQQILDDSVDLNATNMGALMGVYVPGKGSWYGASGKADHDNDDLKAEPDFRFRIGSISKSITSVSILQLKEDGLLELDDSISEYLAPEIVNGTIPYGDSITIRQLLNHTSGVNELADNSECMLDVLQDMTSYRSLEEAVECGAALGAVFSPGTDWSYSNTNYSILAMVIEQVSGVDYDDYVQDNIIEPLGLKNTQIPEDPTIAGNHMGCWWPGSNYDISMTVINSSVYKGWASVVSTTEDLIQYYLSLVGGELITSGSLDEMFTATAPSSNYGLGMELYTLNGDNYFGHSGEVANTSGWNYCDVSTQAMPDGYYISYNFNYQGVNFASKVDQPVHDLLTSMNGD